MIVVCDFGDCIFNKKGFCVKEVLAIRGGGTPAIPVCETMVSQFALDRGAIRPNEYCFTQRKSNIVIEDAEIKEVNDEPTDNKPEEVSV